MWTVTFYMIIWRLFIYHLLFLGTTICDYANVYGKDDVVIYVLILSQFDNLWDLNKYIFIIYGWKIYIYI